MTERILILGALGQIGSELTGALQKKYGIDNVIATDKRTPEKPLEGIFQQLDATDKEGLEDLIKKYQITQVYHMVAVLSATAEKIPLKSWDINMQTLFHVLELAREKQIKRVFWPSSIAAFGYNTPRENTPQTTIMDPGTVYGISKLAGELWCDYYHRQYGVDVRSIRYPGLISYKTQPGGGTTDYAVEIFFEAVKQQKYQCYIAKSTTLPMMYMADAIKATLSIMNAPEEEIQVRTSYNVAAFSFNPEQLAQTIRQHFPNFKMSYQPDNRDAIAQGWPQSIDDSAAQKDWHWQPDYDLKAMVKDMLRNIGG